MTKKEHRPGVHEVNLVIRHLKLNEPVIEEVESAISEIDQLFGMDGVSFDDKSHVINLAYDASHIGIEQIEGIFAEHSLDISHDWWTELKEGYYRFVDQNVKDNAKHEPWSCHTKPPTRGR